MFRVSFELIIMIYINYMDGWMEICVKLVKITLSSVQRNVLKSCYSTILVEILCKIVFKNAIQPSSSCRNCSLSLLVFEFEGVFHYVCTQLPLVS